MIAWIDRNSVNMQQSGFDESMSRIWNGLEIVAEFKMQGIGPDKYSDFKVFIFLSIFKTKTG